MNSIFNLNRFGLLLRRHLALKGQEHLIVILVVLGFAFMGLGGGLWLAWVEGGFTHETAPGIFGEISDSLFSGIMLLSGSIFASQMFSDLGENGTGINYLMNPATHFEKWLVAFFMSTVLFVVVAFGIFYLGQLVNVAVFNEFHPVKIPFSEIGGVFRTVYLAEVMKQFLGIHALFFLGSIWFKSGHWWFTALAAMIAASLFGAITWGLSELIRPDEVHFQTGGHGYFAQIEGEGFFRLPVSGVWSQSWRVIETVFPPLCWGLAYLKLTEKQI